MELGQTLFVAHGFVAIFQLEQERFAVDEGAAVGAAGQRQVVHCTEALKAGVTADLMHSPTEDHFVFALTEHRQKNVVIMM